MIIPSIDLLDGRAVQLRRGREFVLDAGDPLERLEEWSVAGEVAIVDLDAALGRGSNATLIREMVKRVPCRVGGGIRTVESALDWLDAGATRVVIGTAASTAFLGALPRDRVVAAVDAEHGRVVVDGWRSATRADPVSRIAELAPVSGAFLLTQVEVEGMMQGFDRALVHQAAAAAELGGSRLTAAGGITTADDIAWLDQLGADAQVGMALYTGRVSLGNAITAPLRNPPAPGLWPTIVRDDTGQVLGLVWSSRESVAAAVRERRGIYWSRSRRQLWRKGESSGATQRLLRIDLDCDRDTLQFIVRQEGSGFCHTGAPDCFGGEFSLGALERTIRSRVEQPEAGSGTTALLRHPALLAAKLVEEARELGQTEDAAAAEAEAADLLYFALTAVLARGGSLSGITRELARRSGRVRRRPMAAKEPV
jgi:phosphoribosyl-ATP pyrophosphohydrolase